jgi:type II secretory pathway pseudopilin PulG
LVELLTVVTVIVLLATLAIPLYARARQESQLRLCLNNLRILRDCMEQYKFSHSAGAAEVTMQNLLPYLRREPHCPCDGSYVNLGEDPACTWHSEMETSE